MNGARRKTLHRYETVGHARFLTFSCHRREPLFEDSSLANKFVDGLARARQRLGFRLCAWVVMPEHVHLLIVPDLERATVPVILNAIKSPLARRVIEEWRVADSPILGRIEDAMGRAKFWQPGGGYDRNIYSEDEFREKLKYIHENPVKRGIARRPEDYRWSSAVWYAGRKESAAVEVDMIRL